MIFVLVSVGDRTHFVGFFNSFPNSTSVLVALPPGIRDNNYKVNVKIRVVDKKKSAVLYRLGYVQVGSCTRHKLPPGKEVPGLTFSMTKSPVNCADFSLHFGQKSLIWVVRVRWECEGSAPLYRYSVINWP